MSPINFPSLQSLSNHGTFHEDGSLIKIKVYYINPYPSIWEVVIPNNLTMYLHNKNEQLTMRL